MQPLSLPHQVEHYFLAFSGGIDSSVLLHALASELPTGQFSLWHINHGLQSNALQMEQFAHSKADQYGLQVRIDRLDLSANCGQSKGNLEARAREQRYAIFAAGLKSGEALLTAHHQDDQAETLMLNLLRGSGTAGLSGIARERSLGQGRLFRPLLEIPRQQIESYARDHELNWIDDPSNQDDRFNRNYIRHEVLPHVAKRWPGATAQFSRVARWQQESEQLHQDLAQLDLQASEEHRPFASTVCLQIEKLAALSDLRQKNLIRFWIRQQGLALPGHRKMQTLLDQLHAREDATPCISLTGYQIRRYQSALYLCLDAAQLRPKPCYEFARNNDISIPELGLVARRETLFRDLKRPDQDENLQLRFRVVEPGGKPGIHRHHLKRLFQHHRIPPWIRPLIPQIFLNDELAGLLL